MKRRFGRLVSALVFPLLTPCLLVAQTSVEGRWQGSINTPHGALGSGTWRLERAARPDGGWERLTGGTKVSTVESHEAPSLFDEVGGRFYFTRASADFASSRVLVLAREGEDPSPALFSTGPYDAGLTRDPVGDLYIFTSKRPTGDPAHPDAWNLWAVTDDGAGAVPLPSPVNSPASECCAAFAPDGSFLFSTDRDGSWDIYRARPAGAGAWTVTKLEGSLNSDGHEWPSQVARQGGMLLFNSMRPGGFGGDDLFAACRQGSEDRWEAVRLPATVNTEGFEDSGMLTPDGRTYFWSGRRLDAQGTADILSLGADEVGFPDCDPVAG